MFTGLIEAVGRVIECKPLASGVRLRVGTELAQQIAPGESLAVNGVCLTAILAAPDEFHADVGPETLRVTTLGNLGPGGRVNLERPLRADGRLGGHFVQGHVDGLGRIEAIRTDVEFRWLTVRFPMALAPYIIRKGSIALDGISFTVAGLGGDRLDVMVIPFTFEHTGLQYAREGDHVNIECDLIGKYVVRAAELSGLTPDPARAGESTH